ncbi:MAG: GNAT family N-acetyltransferase [Burkholderiaceae bacterium]|jgi:ribosomal protein S18 acetylase RimI-like enzyme|nr:GNAT family N-acetyltransferase [Burkholderiaceae bacterium]
MTKASTRAGAGGARARRRPAAARAPAGKPGDRVVIRAARRADLDQVIAIDATVTGVEKRPYWLSVFRRYGDGARPERHFLVAEADGRVAGFIIGEVRDWEFGAPPCGWVFAIDVAPEFRLAGIATRMLDALRAGFRRLGVRKLRTILARDNTLILSFFRSQGMMTGPFIPLEMDLDA